MTISEPVLLPAYWSIGMGFCPSKREMTKDIQDRELALFLKKCDERKVPTFMTDIEEKIGWIRLWSLSMDQGHKGVSG